MTRRLLALALALGCGGETSITRDTFLVDPPQVPGCIVLDRDRLSFVAEAGMVAAESLRIRNGCEGNLVFQDFILDEEQTPFAVDEPREPALAPGGDLRIEVRFEPVVRGSFSERLVIQTNDPDLPRAEVVLTGETP